MKHVAKAVFQALWWESTIPTDESLIFKQLEEKLKSVPVSISR
jgi:hypothetical protein